MTEYDDNSAVSRSFQKIGTNITFKSALNGFSKEDVIFYVDKLQRDFAGQKRTLSDELDKLHAENHRLNAKIQRHEATIEELATRLKKEYSKPDEFLAERNKYKAEIESLKQTVSALEIELNEQKVRANELTNSLNQAVYNSDTARDQIKALSEKLFAANSQINQARQQLAAEYDRAEKLNQVMNYFKSQSEMFASRCSNMDALCEQNRALQGSVASARQEAQNASANNFRLREQIKSLNLRLLEQQKSLEQQRNAYQQLQQQRYYANQFAQANQYQYGGYNNQYQSQYSQPRYTAPYTPYQQPQQYGGATQTPQYTAAGYQQPAYPQSPAPQRQYSAPMPFASGYNGR